MGAACVVTCRVATIPPPGQAACVTPPHGASAEGGWAAVSRQARDVGAAHQRVGYHVGGRYPTACSSGAGQIAATAAHGASAEERMDALSVSVLHTMGRRPLKQR